MQFRDQFQGGASRAKTARLPEPPVGLPKAPP